jgi:site-specific recombinase XerD
MNRAASIGSLAEKGVALPDGRRLPEGMASPILEEFRVKLQAQARSPCTIDEYSRIIRRFLRYAGREHISSINELSIDDAERFIASNASVSAYAKHQYVYALKSFYKLLGHKDWHRIPRIRLPHREIKALSKDEVSRLLTAADSKRDLAIIYLAYATGMRISEISALNIEDVNFEERSIHIRSGKGDRERYVFFNEECGSLLKAYLAMRMVLDPDEPLFISRLSKRLSRDSIERLFRRAALKAGLISPNSRYEVTFHKLRHSFAVTMLDQIGIFGLKELLGHKSIATTERYLHSDREYLRMLYAKGSGALGLRLEPITKMRS